jgi:glutaminyl-peptide cyclotransferase
MRLFVTFIALAASARQVIERFERLSSAKELRKIHSLAEKHALDIHQPPLSELLIPRVSGTPGNKKVQEYLINTFRDLGWYVEQDPFQENTPLGPTEFNNIIVTNDPQAHRKLVFACHFDSKYFKEFEFIGATDSAAPCSMMIHLAQILSKPLKHRREILGKSTTLQFIFFDGEEAVVDWTDTDSIYGARHLAKRWAETMLTLQSESGQSFTTTPLQQIDAFILLDLLGAKGTTVPNSQSSTQWIWDRLVRIQDRLAVLKLLSTHTQDRIKRGNPIFESGPPRMGANAIQVIRIDIG